MTTNTGSNRKPGTFVPGDKRINRKGRPKSFDQLRALAQMIAHEAGATDADGTPHSNAEMALRKLLRDETAKYLEIAFGKVPTDINVTQSGNIKLELHWPEDADK